MRFLIHKSISVMMLALVLLPMLLMGSVTASENMCNVQRFLRIRHTESNRAMEWSSGIFFGHALSAVATDHSEGRQIWVAERRRKDGYWRLKSDEQRNNDGGTEYCLQAPGNAFRNGVLRMEPCNDDTKAQAWAFQLPREREENEYTIRNSDLEACLTVRADGSYSFMDCSEPEALFAVDEVDVRIS